MQDQVLKLQQAKRLSELGVKGDSVCIYEAHFNEPLLLFRTGISHPEMEQYPAYTVAELGVMLPNCYSTMKLHEGWRVYNEEDQDGAGKDEIFDTEAQARGAALIHLLETNIITVEQCNAALA